MNALKIENKIGSSTLSPSPQDDSRGVAYDEMWNTCFERTQTIIGALRTLPVPRSRSYLLKFMAFLAMDSSTLDLSQRSHLAARRAVQVWFAEHPRRGALHRRFETKRWRFSRDGSI